MMPAGRYSQCAWWLILASLGAGSTVERLNDAAGAGLLWWLLALILCALLRYTLQRGPHADLRSRWAGIAVAACGAALAASRLQTGDWRAVALLIVTTLQAATFIAITRRWQVWLIIATGSMVLLYAATATHSPLYLPCAAAFTLLALNVLTLDYRHQRASQAVFATAATHTERGSGGALFSAVTLLLAIPVYLFVPKPARWSAGEPTPAPLPSYPLPAPAALLPTESATAPLPVPAITAAPIEGSRHIARPERGDYGQDFGIVDVQRHRAQAHTILLYARSSHLVNLRGRTYDRFDGERWSRTFGPPQRIELTGGAVTLLEPPAGSTRVAQSIEVARELDPTLFHAPGVQSLRLPARTLLRYDDGALVATQPLRAATLYSVSSRLGLQADRYLLRADPPLDLSTYLQAEAASLRLRALAQRVTEAYRGPLAKALALEEHLRTQYQYTYEAARRRSAAPLDDFLFATRRGHCELFASALVLMLRSEGIPARLATGFALGDPNPITGFHEVRALDAHAWVEVYLDDAGWLMLEPTPFYPLPRSYIPRQLADQMDGYLERLAATRSFVDPGSLKTRMTVLTYAAWQGARAGLRTTAQGVRRLGWMLPLALVGLALGLLSAYLLAVAAVDGWDNLRIRRALPRLPRQDARTATLVVADALLRMAASRCCLRRPDWTLRDYAQRLHGASNPIVIPEAFIAAFEAARYGSQEQHGSEQTAAVIALIHDRLRRDPRPRLRAVLARLRRSPLEKR